MADAITIQELIDARTDAKTLEEAVNGDAVTTVLSRLGETYPTLSNALNQIDSKLDSADTQIKLGITSLFENGGLPATPFATKALMTASALADGDYAMVTDDTVNNGLYVKTAGAWVKSSYDPLAQAKADSTIKADNAKTSAISTAALDATAKANTAKSEAISASATDATTKANTAKSEAITDAATDATNKANAAQAAAINIASLNADITARAVFKANDEGQYFDASAFSIEAHYNINGQYNTGSPFLQTGFIAVKKGDVITASTALSVGYPWAVMFDSSQVRTGNLGVVTERVFKERTATITQDGFVVIQHATVVEPSASPKFEINKGIERYAKVQPVMDLMSAVNSKADEVKNRYFTDFEQGGGSNAQIENDNVAQARTTDIYKFKAGTVINLKTLNTGSVNNYQIGFGAGSQADIDAGKSPFNTWLAQTDFQVTVAADKPYYRFYIRDSRDTTSTLNIAQALTKISIFVKESVLRDTAIDVGSPSTVTTGYLPPITTPSPFRTSSLATGGVISFIDDDGKAEVLTGLHPFMKGEGVPYGEAIIPARLNTDGYMTTEQFLQIANETEHVEIVDHTFSHFNLASATKERIEEGLINSKKFFASNGVIVDSLVYPFGGDDEPSRAIVAKYYQAAFDYGGQARVETFDTISNRSIKRTTWEGNVDTVAYHKTKIDEAAATNGWLVVCLHVGANTYWYENSYAELSEIIAYARTKGLRFAMPRDGFQIFGNIAENDSGFKIQANGKIIGAS